MEILFNDSQDAVNRKIRNTDIVCTDLDECLFPFFTQVLVAGEILVEAVFKKNKWRYIPQLTGGALFILFLTLITFGNIRCIRNEFLMKCFSRTMRGIPLDLIRKHSRYIHTFFYTESLKLLQYFSARNIPIVILSLSIQPILDELKQNIGFIQECIGNGIDINESNNTFEKYTEPIMKDGHDKYDQFISIMNKLGCSRPLIIGHSDDEIPLVRYAREHNGVSLGINPKKHIAKEFDIVLQSINWNPIVTYVENLDQHNNE